MTSGTGSGRSSRTQDGEHKPEQLPGRSPILTHLIEGFVIQEGNTPFPLERPSFSVDCLNLRRHRGDLKSDCVPLRELKLQEPVLTCELCGKVDFASAFKRSKRFCSTVCAKRYSVSCSKRVGLFPNAKTSIENMKRQRENPALRSCPQEPRRRKSAPGSCPSPQPAQGESSQCADLPYPGASSPRSPLTSPRSPLTSPRSPLTSPRSPLTSPLLSPSQRLLLGSGALPHGLLPADPGRWNVEQVYDFIRSLPGCLDIAEEFRSQEIDGQALLLLKEDHLMSAMNIKLGPALKIFAQINLLKDS